MEDSGDYSYHLKMPYENLCLVCFIARVMVLVLSQSLCFYLFPLNMDYLYSHGGSYRILV